MLAIVPALLVSARTAFAQNQTKFVPPDPLVCDVLVAGGSTAALAAAITAAQVRLSLAVCLTEPTDVLGGQMAFNPAIDYGNMPPKPGREWGHLVANVTPSHSPCWVSRSCYPPGRLEAWITRRLGALPNLQVLVCKASVRR